MLVVPLQTAISLGLAVLVNRKVLRGRGFFRTAFYFPSVTSSVAIVVVFTLPVRRQRRGEQLLGFIGINGPNWFSDPRGVLHLLLGGRRRRPGPGRAHRERLPVHHVVGVARRPERRDERADRCSPSSPPRAPSCCSSWRRCRTSRARSRRRRWSTGPTPGSGSGSSRVPMLRPTLFTVLTLGLIGTWQVFDQVYVGPRAARRRRRSPRPTCRTRPSFTSRNWGQGAAIAFVLFVIIIVLTAFQRWVLRERTTVPRRRAVHAHGSAPMSAPTLPHEDRRGRLVDQLAARATPAVDPVGRRARLRSTGCWSRSRWCTSSRSSSRS